MQQKDYLKETQPIFYQTLENASKQNKISHAYLLVSRKGVNISQVATFLAQSIICNQSLIACEDCEDCFKIKEDNYIDLIRIDGKKERIKKKDIEYIQTNFSKSAISGKEKIYILEHIDDATTESMNSLLKMLEEPEADIHAIFTCDNLNSVLPTIVSRCQVIHFKAINSINLINQLVDLGVSKENALILTQIYDSKEVILNISESEHYFNLKIEALHFLEDYFFKRENLVINTHTNLLKNFKDKKDIDLFLDLSILAIRDVINKSYGLSLVYQNHSDLINKCQGPIDKMIEVIELMLETKEKIKGNSNIPLAIDYLMYHIL
jgi:DNA polymerase III, gamma/tau subunits